MALLRTDDRLLRARVLMGSFLIEIMLAVALFGLFSSGLIVAVLYALEGPELVGDRHRAAFLAQEGLEALRNIRDDDFSLLVTGQHGLSETLNQWILSGASDVTGIYTRQLSLASVDASTWQATSTVTWQQNLQRPGSLSLVTYLTDWAAAQPEPPGVGNWSNTVESGDLNVAGNNNALRVFADASYAYLIESGGSRDFVIVDISDINDPSVESTLNLNNSARDLAVSGNYAYVASTNNSQELQVIDISDKGSPELETSVNLSGSTNADALFLSGSLLYLTRENSGRDELVIFDVSTPSSPTEIGSVNVGNRARDIFVLGTTAYLVSDNNSQEIQAYTVSNPSNPVLAGALNLFGNNNPEVITGFQDRLVVGRRNGELIIVDSTNPGSMSVLGSIDTGSLINDISLGNNNEYAFLATDTNNEEFQVWDISDPSTLTEVGTFEGPSDFLGIFYDADNDRAFVVGENNSEEMVILSPN